MKIILFAAALLSGLVAGLFYAYSCSVNPGLRQLTDAGYIKAMQSINIAIQNPVFFISFMGLLVVYPAAVYMLYKQTGTSTALYMLLLSAVVYYIGVFGLNTEKGIYHRKRRPADVEPVFGNIKHNHGFRRFMLRGRHKVHIEAGLLALAHNLRKKQPENCVFNLLLL